MKEMKSILGLSKREILWLRPPRHPARSQPLMQADEFIAIFDACGALWIWDGDPKKPHALLTSRRHSGEYVNCAEILKRPNLAAILASQLKSRLRREEEFLLPHLVVGPAQGAKIIAHELARTFGPVTISGYTEKIGNDISWGFTAPGNAVILLVEDAITTGGSAEKCRMAIEKQNPKQVRVLPLVCCIINWSGKPNLGNYKIISLIDRTMETWTAEECPLCAQGSEAIRPKPNWRKLMETD